ncbi:MAG: hypothetical protein ACRDJF_08340 [Actinomycetota bacterium]
MSQGDSDRVVLAHSTPYAFVKLQWTGAEPEGLDDPDWAQALGAVWDGDELVAYNMARFRHNFEHWFDDFVEDDD